MKYNDTESQARNYWNKTWSKFLKYQGMIAPSSKLVQHLISNVDRKGTILDLGCGEGRNSLYLSQVGYSIVGLDLSMQAIKVMKNNFFEEELKGTAVRADARFLPLKNESINGILAHHLFDHLDFQGCKMAINEAYRILSPDGVMLMTVSCLSQVNTDNDAEKKTDGSFVYLKGSKKGMLVRPFIKSEIDNLPSQGWKILKNETTRKGNRIILLKKNSQTKQ